MREERAEYVGIVRELGGDLAGRREALARVRASDAWAYGSPVPFSYVPNLYSARDFAYLARECATMHAILCKVIRRYVDDPSYRPLFGFSPEVERLILLPCGYGQLLPMARFDLFLDEGDESYKFCEFNADGAAGGSRDLVIGEALAQGEAYRRFAARHRVRPFELFDAWADAFMRVYRTDALAAERPRPTIAITDFDESGVHSDFDRFIAAFERAGHPARFVDVRSFDFDGEHLVDPADGTVIDAVFRRSVTSELATHPGECDALIDAVAARRVCLIGHFRTTVAHSKMVNVALFDPATDAFLTPDERAFVRAHVPRTYRLAPDALGTGDAPTVVQVKADRASWILKPADDYGAHGVVAGVDASQQAWERAVDERLAAGGSIVQEFYQPRYVEALDARVLEAGEEADPCDVRPWEYMPGMFLYDGRAVGFYGRLGQGGVIANDHGGLVAPSFLVE